METQAKERRTRWIAYGVVFVLLVLLHQFSRATSGDDMFYIQKSREMGFWEFLASFYKEWSGRVFSNAMAYLLLDKLFWLWRILNSLVLCVAAWCVPRLVKGAVNAWDFVISVSLLFLMNANILFEAVFWGTGSLYYLWPAAGALLVLIPFADRALRGQSAGKGWPLLLLPAVMAGAGNEQVALCTLGFMLAAMGYGLLRQKKLPLWPQLPLLCGVLAGFAVMMLAPGNAVRYNAEIETWFPEFPTLGFGQRLAIGAEWLFDMLFSTLRVLVLLCFVLLCWMLWRAKRGNEEAARLKHPPLWPLLCGLLALLPLAAWAVGQDVAQWLFSFGKPVLAGPAGWLLALAPYLFWGLFLLAWLALAIRGRPLAALCLAAGVCSLAILCFSPTMYASGYRTAFVTGLLLAVALQLCLAKTEPNEKRTGTVLAVVLPVAALVNLADMVLMVLYKISG